MKQGWSSYPGALSEIFVVALLGSLISQVGLSSLGVPSDQILGHTHLFFIFLVFEASLTLVLITLFLKLRGEKFRDIGWVKENSGRDAALAVAIVPALFGSTLLVDTLFHHFFPELVSVTNPLLELIRNRSDLVLFLISSMFVGGIKEEVQRAFVLARFERYLGELLWRVARFLWPLANPSKLLCERLALIVGLALWSLFFALGHSVQGPDKMVAAGILGLWFGLVYVWRRALTAPILAHALYDVVTILLFWNFVRSV